MNAVFTDSPYKCWNYGAKGELHIFDYDSQGSEFAKLNGFCLSETPNDFMCTQSWCGLVANWMDFEGDVVLHLFTDERDDGDFEEWVLSTARNYMPGCTVNFRYENDGQWVTANIRLSSWPEIGKSHRVRCLALKTLMVELYDIEPIEFWDDDRRTNDLVTLDEIAA